MRAFALAALACCVPFAVKAKEPTFEEASAFDKANGLVFISTFVPFACPGWSVDRKVLDRTLTDIGFTADRIKDPKFQEQLKFKREAWSELDAQSIAGRCRQAVEMVGPYGSELQGLVIPQ